MTKYLIILIFLLSCAQVTSLNLKRHQFGRVPTKIIWLQIAGLGEEHLALLKYDKKASYKSSFEESLCVGTTWNYNLFQLRMSAQDSFLSELTNRENIKGECSDYENKPIWSLLSLKNYKTALLESPSSKKQSLLNARACEHEEFLDKITIFKMEKDKKAVGENLFHFSERLKVADNGTYYDRSCIEGDCEDTFVKNSMAITEKFISGGKNSFLLIRDFTYLNTIEKNDYKGAKTVLEGLNFLASYFQEVAKKDPSVLFLITSAQARNIDFPRAGKEWKQFIESNKKAINRNSQMVSPVFVSGARAENFCSMYKQSEVLERMFTGAKKQGLELIMLNPFSN
jgi:hypothetical protein